MLRKYSFLLLLLVSLLTSCSSVKNRMTCSYYASIVEKCVNYNSSSQCVWQKGGLDFKTGLPVYLTERPKRAADIKIEFGMYDQWTPLEVETNAEKACRGNGIDRELIHYEAIENTFLGISYKETISIWCSSKKEK